MVNELASSARDIIRFVCVWNRVMFCFWCWFYYHFVCVYMVRLLLLLLVLLLLLLFSFHRWLFVYVNINTHKRSAHQRQCLINIQHYTISRRHTLFLHTFNMSLVLLLCACAFFSLVIFLFVGSIPFPLCFPLSCSVAVESIDWISFGSCVFFFWFLFLFCSRRPSFIHSWTLNAI